MTDFALFAANQFSRTNQSTSPGWNPVGDITGPTSGANVGRSYQTTNIGTPDSPLFVYTSTQVRCVLVFDTSSLNGAAVSSANLALSVNGGESFTLYYASSVAWAGSSGIAACSQNGGGLANAGQINTRGNTYLIAISNQENLDPGGNALSQVLSASLQVQTGTTPPTSGNPPQAPQITNPLAGQTVTTTPTLSALYQHPDNTPGTVTFLVNGATLGTTSTVSAGATASLAASLSTGNHTLVAYATDQYNRVSANSGQIAFTVGTAPTGSPDTPTILLPFNGSTISVLNVSLQASYQHPDGVSGAVIFTLSRVGNPDLLYTGTQVVAGGVSQAIIPQLPSAAFQMTAYAQDANGHTSGTTASLSFSTTAGPGTPTIVRPGANATVGSPTQLQALYSDSQGIPGFVQFTITGNGGTTSFNGTTVSSGQLSNASASLAIGSYQLTAKSFDSQSPAQVSPTTAILSFTVAAVPVAANPSPAGTPTDPALISATTPVLSVTYQHTGGLAGSAFQFRAWNPGQNESNGAPVWDTGIQLASLPLNQVISATVAQGAFTFGQGYEWEARVRDVNGLWSEYCARQSVTTNIAPNAPTLSDFPADTVIFTFPKTFTIGFSDPVTVNRMTKYQWQVLGALSPTAASTTVIKDSGEVAVPNQTAATATITNTDADPAKNLNWQSIYFLQVRTWDDFGVVGPWTQPVRFFTNDYPTAVASYPTGDIVITTTQPLLTWVTLDAYSDPGQTFRYWIEIYQLDANRNRVGLAYSTGGWLPVVNHLWQHRVTSGLIAGEYYEWQIKLDDGWLQSQTWAAGFRFLTTGGPSVAITNPISGGVISASRVLVEWTYGPDPSTLLPQATYRILVTQNGVGTIYDSQTKDDLPNGLTRSYIIPSGTIPFDSTANAFAIYVEVGDTNVTSRSAPATVSTVFPVVPQVSLLDVVSKPDLYYNQVSWLPVAMAASEFSEYRVCRKALPNNVPVAGSPWPVTDMLDTGHWYAVGTVGSLGTPGEPQIFRDYLVASGRLYLYAVVAVTRVDGWTDVALSTQAQARQAGITHANGSVLASTGNPDLYRLLANENAKLQDTRQPDYRDFYPQGRQHALRVYGTQDSHKWQFTFQCLASRKGENRDMVNVLMDRHEVLYLADSRGAELYCAIDQMAITWVAMRGLYEIQVQLTEQDSPFATQAMPPVV